MMSMMICDRATAMMRQTAHQHVARDELCRVVVVMCCVHPRSVSKMRQHHLQLAVAPMEQLSYLSLPLRDEL
jgi:hypothetical protein